MERIIIDDLIEKIYECVKKHNLEKPGQYSRWLWGERDLGINEYGCADALNILYSINKFPETHEEREGFADALMNMQNPETGLFTEATHHTIHTTAHCSAALELLDKKPRYKCFALEKYTTKEGLYDLLENEVNWQNPWPQSHKGAGILPCLTNTDMVSLQWKDWYFDWMWNHTDEETGFFFHGDKKEAPLYMYMAGGFHYIFNHEAERRPLKHPEKIIDSCIFLMENIKNPEYGNLITRCTFIDIDVVYCLTRAMRQTPYRFYDGKKALEKYAERYIKFMLSVDYDRDEGFNDLHMLFGAVCCLCELQSALPGKIITSKPLRLVLDRRPFI